MVLNKDGENKMKNNTGQMLLLTGITMILIFISASFISTQIANVELESSLEKSHPLTREYQMVKENFKSALINQNYASGEIEKFNSIVQRFKSIESKHNINFDASIVDDSTFELTLSNSDTTITEEFKLN